MTSTMTTVSIIIPVLNDTDELNTLLRSIRDWSSQPKEIIVVDAAADEACKLLCHTYGAQWLAFKKTRGAQQRFGAQHASGDTLWFLFADCLPHSQSLTAIKACMKTHYKGGFFRFSFNLSKKNITQKILEHCINWRSRHFIAYGDQGLFFDKQAYFVLDGHSDQSLFEEVKLITKIKNIGFKRLDLPIYVSARKWLHDGFWKRTLHNRLLALKYKFGESVDTLHTQYYSK